MEQLDVLAAIGHHEIIEDAFVVIEEILFDEVRFVSEAQDEILVAEVRIVFHQMPEDGHVADLHQRFRQAFFGLTETHSEAAAKEYNLHNVRLPFKIYFLDGGAYVRGSGIGTTNSPPHSRIKASCCMISSLMFHGKIKT